MFNTERYPIDYDAIRKGDVITRGRLEEILGEPGDTARFHALRAELACEIEDHLWDDGKPWTVCIVEGEIRVLTDPEASRYNSKRFLRHERGLGQSHKQMLAVDVGKLDPDERRAHDRNAQLQGMRLAALAAARRATLPLPPPLPPRRLPFV